VEKVRSRKAPVFGKVDKVVAPKGYLANAEGGPANETLQSVRSDMLTNGQVVWVKSQQALYVYSQTGTAPAYPLGVAVSPTGCWRRVAPELYQFGAGAPTVDAAYVSQDYLDTTNDVWYKAVTTGTGASDWVLGGGTTSPLALVDREDNTIYESAWKVTGLAVGQSGGQATIDSGLVNIYEFGAVGNGIADDRQALVDAIAAALNVPPAWIDDPTKGDDGSTNLANRKSVFLPYGNFLISSEITIRFRNVSIVGPTCGTQGGLLSSAPILTFGHGDAGFRLDDGPVSQFNARDICFKGIRFLRTAGFSKQGQVLLVDTTQWTSGITFDECSGSGHHTLFEVSNTYVASAALARLRILRCFFGNCRRLVYVPNAKHLCLSEISDSRISSFDEDAIQCGFTGSRIATLDLESNDSTGSPITLTGSASGDITFDSLYFENIDSGLACMNINLATNVTINSIRAVSNISIPVLRVSTSQNVNAPDYPIVARGSIDCVTMGTLIPNTADTHCWAAWRLQSAKPLARVGDTPYTLSVQGSLVDWNETVFFGDRELPGRRIGTPGVPLARLGPYAWNTVGFDVGDTLVLMFACRYEDPNLPENFCSFSIDARRSSDSVYEIGVWEGNSYSLRDIQANDTVQHILLLKNFGANNYNAIRLYWNMYGNAADAFYDGLISQIAWCIIPDAAANGVVFPNLDVPTLIDLQP
jgi:hypothetical protein